MKQQTNDLALLGGVPAFNEILHVGRPNIGDRQRLHERLDDMLDRRWFTNSGPYVQEFEKKIAEMVGVKHCIAMCNATIALEIVARALGLTGEVIVPSFTFVATAHALQWLGITPVFADIASNNPNIDPEQIEQMITPRTTAIMGVHVWGNPCNVEALTAIAEKHNLKLFFDAAHAFACTHNGKMIGGFGDAEVFSFHATKFLNSFEGGAVVTNDDALAKKVRLMHNFGFAGMDNVIYIGTNGKMSEICAAMGLTSLENIDFIIDENRKNYHAYKEGVTDIPGVTLKQYDESEKCNYQYVALEIDETVAGINRDTLVKLLHAENVRARRYFYPGVHQMEPYASHFPHAGMLLPETEKLTQRVVCMPTGTSVNAGIVADICQLLAFIVSNQADIQAQLENRRSRS